MPVYGRDQAHIVTDALLLLNLNYTNSQKEKLYIRLVQYGLDIYGTQLDAQKSLNISASEDGFYRGSGGLNVGRKAPMVLAGLALNDANIKEWSDAKKHLVFHEDKQTFYVTQADVDRPRWDRKNPNLPAGVDGCSAYYSDGTCQRKLSFYSKDMIGLADWSADNHLLRPMMAGSNMTAYYRGINSGPFVGHALAMNLIKGGKAAWNNPAFFDYSERWWNIQQGLSQGVWSNQLDKWPNSINKFSWEMWKKYR